MRSGKSKIGRFFLFIGLSLLVIFFAMDHAKHPSYGYFCIGIILAVLGGFFVITGHKPPEESMRFRTLRRWREQQRQRKEEKKNNPLHY